MVPPRLRGGVSLTADFCPIPEVPLDTMDIPDKYGGVLIPIWDGHATVRLGSPGMEVSIA